MESSSFFEQVCRRSKEIYLAQERQRKIERESKIKQISDEFILEMGNITSTIEDAVEAGKISCTWDYTHPLFHQDTLVTIRGDVVAYMLNYLRGLDFLQGFSVEEISRSRTNICIRISWHA